MTERPHHPFGPSRLAYLEQCAHYEGHDVSNPAAELGTRQHRALETMLDDNTLGDEEATAVARCAEAVDKLRAELGGGSELREVYLSIDDADTTGGYADLILLSPDKTQAVVIDYKFGKHPVEDAETNAQGVAYSLGVFHRFPTVERVRVVFLQPHIEYRTEHTFCRADVASMLARVNWIVAEAKFARTDPTFANAKPNFPSCLFCRHNVECPKLTELAIKIAHMFYPLEIPADVTPSKLHSDRDTQAGLRLASVVKVWAEAFRARVTDRVIRGDANIPEGFTIATQSRRSLKDPKLFRELALKYITPEVYDATLEPTLGAVETAIEDATPRGSKTATVKAFQDELLHGGAVSQGQPYSFLKPDTGAKGE